MQRTAIILAGLLALAAGLPTAIAQVPAVGQLETRRRDELPFRAHAFEEHDQLEREEDHRVDTRMATVGVARPRPRADEAEVPLCLQVVGAVVDGNLFLRHRCA